MTDGDILNAEELPWKYDCSQAGYRVDLGNRHGLVSSYRYAEGCRVEILRRKADSYEVLRHFRSQGIEEGRAEAWRAYMDLAGMGQVPQVSYVLLTGFKPFGAYLRNPTERIVNRLHGEVLPNERIVFAKALPCLYGAAEGLIELISKVNATSVLSLGYASRVPKVRIETRGYNERNSTYPDAEGLICSGEPIDPVGAAFYDSPFDQSSLVNAVSSSDLEVEISCDPERFICNDLLYQVLRGIRQSRLDIKFGYMHVPTTDVCADLIDGQPEKVVIPEYKLVKAITSSLQAMSEDR